MSARVLTATNPTAVMTITKGVFIVTSLLRIYRLSFRVENELKLNVQAISAATYRSFWPPASFTTKAAPMSSTDQGGGKRRVVINSVTLAPVKRNCASVVGA